MEQYYVFHGYGPLCQTGFVVGFSDLREPTFDFDKSSKPWNVNHTLEDIYYFVGEGRRRHCICSLTSTACTVKFDSVIKMAGHWNSTHALPNDAIVPDERQMGYSLLFHQFKRSNRALAFPEGFVAPFIQHVKDFHNALSAWTLSTDSAATDSAASKKPPSLWRIFLDQDWKNRDIEKLGPYKSFLQSPIWENRHLIMFMIVHSDGSTKLQAKLRTILEKDPGEELLSRVRKQFSELSGAAEQSGDKGLYTTKTPMFKLQQDEEQEEEEEEEEEEGEPKAPTQTPSKRGPKKSRGRVSGGWSKKGGKGSTRPKHETPSKKQKSRQGATTPAPDTRVLRSGSQGSQTKNKQ
jgi:hypothetical protein